MKYSYAPLILLLLSCSHQYGWGRAALGFHSQGEVSDETTIEEPIAVKPRAKWMKIADDCSRIPCDYEVEARYLHFRTAGEDIEVSAAATYMESVLTGEGTVKPSFDSIASALAELWAAQPDVEKLVSPARQRITRGTSNVLQYTVKGLKRHLLYTPDYSIGFSDPPGQLVIESRRSASYITEPQTILSPLPWGDDLDLWKACKWEPIKQRIFRAQPNNTDSRGTVLLDESERPIAFWDRYGKEPRSVNLGVYQWSKKTGTYEFPLQAVSLMPDPGGIYAIMYRVRVLSLEDPGVEPTLDLYGVDHWIDARGKRPTRHPLPLPDFLKGLVEIKG